MKIFLEVPKLSLALSCDKYSDLTPGLRGGSTALLVPGFQYASDDQEITLVKPGRNHDSIFFVSGV